MFKAGVGRDEARRGRNETQVQIRKEKKEERLNQRRRKAAEHMPLANVGFSAIPEDSVPAIGAGNAGVDAGTQMRVSY